MTATGPLGGVRVLELSRVLAGPWAAQLLADLGADVVKVERPGAGDDTRAWGPPWLPGPGPSTTSAYFASTNRNKRSIAVDLAAPLGRDVVRGLALAADVVLDNFKVDTLARWGLDGDTLRRDHPGLVTCAITGFGETGPARERPGYDLLVQAMGGLMSITGEPDREPMKVGVAVADLMTGMYAAVAILAALRHRDRTGVGQHIDLSLYDTQLAWLANQGLNHLATGVPPARRGNAHPNIVPYQVFHAADGHLVIAVGNDGQFRALCGALGRPELADDPRYATNADRVLHREGLVAALGGVLRARPRAHWQAALDAVGVPCGPVRDIGEALADAVAVQRGAVVTQPDPVAGVVRTLANPIRLSVTPVRYDRPPPGLGAHTDEVLADWLGAEPSAIAGLRAAGVVG